MKVKVHKNTVIDIGDRFTASNNDNTHQVWVVKEVHQDGVTATHEGVTNHKEESDFAQWFDASNIALIESPEDRVLNVMISVASMLSTKLEISSDTLTILPQKGSVQVDHKRSEVRVNLAVIYVGGIKMTIEINEDIALTIASLAILGG